MTIIIREVIEKKKKIEEGKGKEWLCTFHSKNNAKSQDFETIGSNNPLDKESVKLVDSYWFTFEL